MITRYPLITNTYLDGVIQPLSTDTANLKRVIYRTDLTTPWSGGLVIMYPQVGDLGINKYLDSTSCLFDANDISFYKPCRLFSNLECTNFDIKCKTLSGDV